MNCHWILLKKLIALRAIKQTRKKRDREKIASFCESSSSLTTADRKKSQQAKKEQENSSQGCRNSEESQLNRKVTLQFLYKKSSEVFELLRDW